MTIEHLTEKACPLCMGSVAVDGTILRVACPHCGLEFPVRNANPARPKPREPERGSGGEIRLAAWLQDEPYDFRRQPSPSDEDAAPKSKAGSARRSSSRSFPLRTVALLTGILVIAGFVFVEHRPDLPFLDRLSFLDWEDSGELARDVLPAEPVKASSASFTTPASDEPDKSPESSKKPATSKKASKKTPEKTPEETPEEKAERTAEKAPEKAPEEPVVLRPADSPVWLLSGMAERRLAHDPKASLVFAAEAARQDLDRRGCIDPGIEQTLRNAIGAVREAGLRFPETTLELLALTPNGRWLAAAGGGKEVYVWDLSRLSDTHDPFVLSGHHEKVTALAADPAGRVLASGDAGGDLILWNLDQGNPTEPPQSHSLFADAVEHIAVSADGTRLVAVGKEQGLSVAKWIDLASPSPLPKGLERLSEEIECVAADPRGEWAAIAGEGKRIHVYRLEHQPPTRKRILSDHAGRVTCVRTLGDGSRLVSGGADGVVCLWDLRRPKGTEPVRFRHGGGQICELAVSQDDSWLAALAADQTVCLWNLGIADPQQHGILLPRTGTGVSSITFAENGSRFATTGGDGSVRLWRLSEGEPIDNPIVLRGPGHPARHLASAANGWIVTASESQGSTAIFFWDTNSEGLLRTAQTLLEEAVSPATRRKLLADVSGPALIRR